MLRSRLERVGGGWRRKGSVGEMGEVRGSAVEVRGGQLVARQGWRHGRNGANACTDLVSRLCD